MLDINVYAIVHIQVRLEALTSKCLCNSYMYTNLLVNSINHIGHVLI